MKTDEQIISAFNEICDTLAGRKLAVKVQTLLIRSTRGNELINTFLEYKNKYKETSPADVESRKLYDHAAAGAFEFLLDEINNQCDAEITADERFRLFCFLSSIQ